MFSFLSKTTVAHSKYSNIMLLQNTNITPLCSIQYTNIYIYTAFEILWL